MNAEVNALSMENLDIAYRVGGRDLRVLRRLSFHIAAGEAYGLVGESGSGKSTAALAAVRYLPPNGRVLDGKIFIAGRDLFALGREKLRRLRATAISMVYQDPARALNPSIRVGEQIAEVFRLQGLPGGINRNSYYPIFSTDSRPERLIAIKHDDFVGSAKNTKALPRQQRPHRGKEFRSVRDVSKLIPVSIIKFCHRIRLAPL